MAIFREINPWPPSSSTPDAPIEKGGIAYFDEDMRHAMDSAVVHLGSGDVLISSTKRRFDYVDEIVFNQAVEPHPVGQHEPKWIDTPTYAPVVLRFDNVASVDVLLAEIARVRDALVAAGSGNGTAVKGRTF